MSRVLRSNDNFCNNRSSYDYARMNMRSNREVVFPRNMHRCWMHADRDNDLRSSAVCRMWKTDCEKYAKAWDALMRISRINRNRWISLINENMLFSQNPTYANQDEVHHSNADGGILPRISELASASGRRTPIRGKHVSGASLVPFSFDRRRLFSRD